MPNYDYQCDSCAHQQVEQRRIADRDNPGTCAACGGVCKRAIVAPPHQKLYGSDTGYTDYERIKYRL